MLKLKLIIVIFVVLAVGLQVSAEGTSSIMEKLVQLEEKLDRLEAVQQRQAGEVDEKLSTVGSTSNEQLAESVAEVQTEISQIEAELAAVRQEAQFNDANISEEVGTLTALAGELRQAIDRLENLGAPPAPPAEPEKKAKSEAKAPCQEGGLDSKFSVKFYGFVKLEAIYDNTELAKGDWLLYVKDGDSDAMDQDIFTMNARHTRFGFKFDGPCINDKGKVLGLIEADFAGGFPNSSTAARQPILRLRHAWVEVNYPTWEARFGQDWALIASPFPNTTSFVVGAGKGNLWMRYPQIKFTVKKDPIKFAISLNRPMAGNIKYEDYDGGDFDPVGDGERSGLPWIMGRVWLKSGIATFSVSGHFGLEQINTMAATDTVNGAPVYSAVGDPEDVSSYSINADVVLTSGPVSLTARGFYGENLNSFFGGVFQGYTRDTDGVYNIASMGGWGQVKYTFNPAWSATLGGGMDDPNEDDLSAGMRDRNDWIFANVAYSVKKALIFMLETEYLQTSYIEKEAGDNLRLQFVTYYKF